MLSATDRVRLRDRNRQAGAGIATPLTAVPDAELIACLVEHGQPRWSAELLKRDPMLRLAALRFWVDVGDARRGDAAAKDRVDYIRASWSAMRVRELISDDPARGHARAQLVDPAELL